MRRCRGAGLAALPALLLLVAMARAQIEQEPSLETTEGTGINITCSHPKIQTFDWIQWYRQLPGQAPKLLALTMKESKELPDDLGQLWVSADRRWSALRLGWPRRGDAAVYYCALGHGQRSRGCGRARTGAGGAGRGQQGALPLRPPGPPRPARPGIPGRCRNGTDADTDFKIHTGTESPTILSVGVVQRSSGFGD
uniref:T cell receptor alpha variable 4 n=1 Tax=Lonchura striata TaxID=40157 RepID=UPI0012934866|nr:T cell receptor alpha variable 4 [Lonchura striata domestica]